MKIIKKILCLMLVVLAISSLCACVDGSDSSSTKEKTPEQQVRSAVEASGRTAYFGKSIGGNEIKSSSATITNVKKISDTEYLVSGKVVMTDVYGTKWNNNFDCTVRKSGDRWSAGSFDYTSSKWTKG